MLLHENRDCDHHFLFTVVSRLSLKYDVIFNYVFLYVSAWRYMHRSTGPCRSHGPGVYAVVGLCIPVGVGN